MRGVHILLLATACLATTVYAGCTNGYMNGLPCATTTRYYDGQKGACGCGDASGNSQFSWASTTYTAAASQVIYNPSDATVSWCGSGCGACFRITPTGDCPTGGNCVGTQTSIVIMVTNLCPYNGNQQWCPNPGNTNTYGYGAHFDLEDLNMNGQISALKWDNPVVTYQQVPCDGNTNAPTCSEAATCQCSTQMAPQCTAGNASIVVGSSTSGSSSTSTSSSHSASSSTSTTTTTTSSASASTSHSASSSSTSSAGATSTTAAKSSSTSSSASSTSDTLQSSTSGSNTAASTSSATASCPLGSSTCPCTQGGACDTGLTCTSNVCVADSFIQSASSSVGDSLYAFTIVLGVLVSVFWL